MKLKQFFRSKKESNAFDRPATAEDVRRLFQLCLGRFPNEKSTREKQGAKLKVVLTRLLQSEEFVNKVLPSLGTPKQKLRITAPDEFARLQAYVEKNFGRLDAEMTSPVALLRKVVSHNDGELAPSLTKTVLPDGRSLSSRLTELPLDIRSVPEPAGNYGAPWDDLASDEDIVLLFRLCLGRTPNDRSVQSKKGLSLGELFLSLLESQEFLQKVRPTLEARKSRLYRGSQQEMSAFGNAVSSRLELKVESPTSLTPAALLLNVLEHSAGTLLSELRANSKVKVDSLLSTLAKRPQHLKKTSALTEDRVRAFLFLLLGRTPNANDKVAQKIADGEDELVFKLLFSDECLEAFIFPILERRPFAHQHVDESPPEWLLAALNGVDCLAPASQAVLNGVRSWFELAALFLTDATFDRHHLHPHPIDVHPFRLSLILRARSVLQTNASEEKVFRVALASPHELTLHIDGAVAQKAARLQIRREDAEAKLSLLLSELGPTDEEGVFRLPLPESFSHPPLRTLSVEVFSPEGKALQSTTPFAVGPLDDTIASWVAKARRALKNGDQRQAEGLLERVIQWSSSATYQVEAAQVFAWSGRVEDALSLLIKLDNETDEPQAHLLHGGILASRGEWGDARAHFLACKEADYRTPLSTLLVRISDDALGKFGAGNTAGIDPESLRLLSRLLSSPDKGPAGPSVELLREKTFDTLELCLEACLTCLAASEQSAKIAQLLISREGSSLEALADKYGNLGLLPALLPTLTLFDPSSFVDGLMLLALARFLEGTGQIERAAAFAEAASLMVPSVPNAEKIAGVLLHKAGRLEDAVRSLEKVVAASPSDVRSWKRLAGIERQMISADPDHSGDALDRVISKLIDFASARLLSKPDDDAARLLLVHSLVLAERFVEAHSILERLYLDSTTPATKSDCVRQLTQVCEKLALTGEAEKWARLQIATAPSERATVALAKALRARDRAEEAQLTLDEWGDPDDLELTREQARNLFYLGRFEEAARRSELSLQRFPDDATLRLYSAASHLEAGNIEEGIQAAALVDPAREATSFKQDLALLRFDLLNRSGKRSDAFLALNELFRSLGCQDIQLRSEASSPFFDRLSPTGKYETKDSKAPLTFAGPLVSVIMTAYNAEDHIATAVRSLLEQSYTNLEVIVVDDASTDATPRILNDLAKEDPRICPVLRTQNSGTYVSKNTGLLHATGEFVAFQDSDDWSHPDRLAKTISFLSRRPDVVGLTTDWIRMTTEGQLVIKAGVQISHVCCISLVFRREPVLRRVGFFDSVRIEADMELIRRLRLVFGASSVPRIRWPLLFGRFHEASLTSNNEYGITRTGFTTPRLTYQAEQRKWHSAITQGKPAFMPFPLNRRPFEAPDVMLPDREADVS